MAFPLDVRADMATCDMQFGSVRRPTHPTTSWDAAKFEVCAHRYVDIAEPDFGVAILNNGRYGHGVFDGQVRVSLLRAARYPDPDADQGRHAVDLAVYPHGSGLADVVREAERFNMPGAGRAAVRPPQLAAPVVSLTGAGVEIDAVKLADDGERRSRRAPARGVRRSTPRDGARRPAHPRRQPLQPPRGADSAVSRWATASPCSRCGRSSW